MVQVIPVILTFHTHGTGISAGIISALYRDYICSVAHETTKEFWKNSYFKNRRANFLLWYQKLTSVRNKFNLSMKWCFLEVKIVFCVCLGPKKGLKYHLETVKTIFSQKNNYYYWTIFVKLNFFHAWKLWRYELWRI